MPPCWFEKIPPTDFDEDKTVLMTQLGATKWSSNIKFYRGASFPRGVDDLVKDLRANHLVWIDDNCFLVLKKLPKSVPFFSKFRKASANIDFAQKSVFLYGTSKRVVSVATARLLYLKDRTSQEVRVGWHYCPLVADCLVPTYFVRAVFLKYYIRANPQRRLILGRGCLLSKRQSIALASHPNPLNVGIECMFEDGGRAFMETLKQRTSDFGTLFSHSRISDSIYNKYCFSKVIPEVMSTCFEYSLKTSSCFLDSSQHLLPLTSTAQRVEYNVYDTICCDGMESLNISPKAVTLVFHSVPSKFHKLFLEASGSLREMGLVYDVFSPPSSVQQSLLTAGITANKNLKRLEVGCPSVFGDYWPTLLETIWSHGSIRSVVFWVQSNNVLSRYLGDLVSFLEKYAHVDVTFKCRDPKSSLAYAMDCRVKPYRMENRAKALTRLSDCDRPAVFGAALTTWANGEFYKVNHLVVKNVDLICSLMVDSPYCSSPQGQGKRPRDLSSIPQLAKQKKIVKLDSSWV